MKIIAKLKKIIMKRCQRQTLEKYNQEVKQEIISPTNKSKKDFQKINKQKAIYQFAWPKKNFLPYIPAT